MVRPAFRPESTQAINRLTIELADAIDVYAREHGIPKREVYELALRRQFTFHPEPGQQHPAIGSRKRRRTKIVSSYISVELAEALESYAAAHGVPKADVMEYAVASVLEMNYVPDFGGQMHLGLAKAASRKAS
ncbi:MAG: hypothetical protein LLG14_12140 [Nocardiaceae bacterium]|nr:hypothetical protein [Nocardiaceae bacterium]